MTDPDQPQGGRFVGGAHHFPLRVYTEETDAGGIVYHANYLRYFERARSDMLSLVGADYVGALTGGEGFYVVTSAQLAFRRPARLGDALLVVSRLGEVRAASTRVMQRVLRGDELLVEGEVIVAFVTPDGRPQRQPAAWMEAFRTLPDA